ncbi:hypothetical protein Hanom_Chr05g00465751 [Helianthus anomalus]
MPRRFSARILSLPCAQTPPTPPRRSSCRETVAAGRLLRGMLRIPVHLLRTMYIYLVLVICMYVRKLHISSIYI